MRGSDADTGADVIDVLRREDEDIRRLLGEYFDERSAGDHVRRGALGKQLVERCSIQDSVKEELVHGLLLRRGHEDLARELDARSAERRRLVERLNDLSVGVTSRDVHLSDRGEFDATVGQLRERLEADLSFEEQRVAPVLTAEVPADERRELGERVDRARAHAPARPAHGAGPAHSANPLVRRWRSAVSKLRNVADAPAYHPTSKD